MERVIASANALFLSVGNKPIILGSNGKENTLSTQLTTQIDEVRAHLQEQAKAAAHKDETISVDVGVHPGAPAFSACVRFIAPNGAEEYMSATGRNPEEACQNVRPLLGARILTEQKFHYRTFAKRIAEAIGKKFPKADIPGNDGATGVYLWKYEERHAQMQNGGENRVLLHLWSDEKHRTAILNGYDDATCERVVDAISKFLN